MAEMYCPNCGHHLVGYRTERQRTGSREVDLEWTICQHCRHVGLQSWNFANGSVPRAGNRQDGVPQRSHDTMRFSTNPGQ